MSYSNEAAKRLVINGDVYIEELWESYGTDLFVYAAGLLGDLQPVRSPADGGVWQIRDEWEIVWKERGEFLSKNAALIYRDTTYTKIRLVGTVVNEVGWEGVWDFPNNGSFRYPHINTFGPDSLLSLPREVDLSMVFFIKDNLENERVGSLCFFGSVQDFTGMEDLSRAFHLVFPGV